MYAQRLLLSSDAVSDRKAALGTSGMVRSFSFRLLAWTLLAQPSTSTPCLCLTLPRSSMFISHGRQNNVRHTTRSAIAHLLIPVLLAALTHLLFRTRLRHPHFAPASFPISNIISPSKTLKKKASITPVGGACLLVPRRDPSNHRSSFLLCRYTSTFLTPGQPLGLSTADAYHPRRDP